MAGGGIRIQDNWLYFGPTVEARTKTSISHPTSMLQRLESIEYNSPLHPRVAQDTLKVAHSYPEILNPHLEFGCLGPVGKPV